MDYYGAPELAESFRTVRKNTLVIAREIPEDKYGVSVAEGMRTFGSLLAHISVATALQYRLHGVEGRNSFAGFDLKALITSVLAEESKPRTKNETVAMLVESGEQWAECVAGFSEEFLASRVQFPAGAEPPAKTRFEMILAVKEHEMHHRAQLMVMQRVWGMVPHLTRALELRNRELLK